MQVKTILKLTVIRNLTIMVIIINCTCCTSVYLLLFMFMPMFIHQEYNVPYVEFTT